MVSLKELRAVTGRLSWMAGILPRLRWTTSVFYAVITGAMRDIESGQELKRVETVIRGQRWGWQQSKGWEPPSTD